MRHLALSDLTAAASAAAPARPSWPPRACLAACVLLAVVAGVAFARTSDAAGGTAGSGDAGLVRLLQMMAVLKGVMATAAVGLIDWRLRYAARPPLVASYLLAASLLAAGPCVMFRPEHLIAGAVLFHAGLALLIVLGWTDRATAGEVLGRAVANVARGSRRQPDCPESPPIRRP